LSENDPRIANVPQERVRQDLPALGERVSQVGQLEGKQGHAIISLVIHSMVTVSNVNIARPSGVPEFDENVRSAVLRAAPFAAFPPTIPAPVDRWSITFPNAKNPPCRESSAEKPPNGAARSTALRTFRRTPERRSAARC